MVKSTVWLSEYHVLALVVRWLLDRACRVQRESTVEVRCKLCVDSYGYDMMICFRVMTGSRVVEEKEII